MLRAGKGSKRTPRGGEDPTPLRLPGVCAFALIGLSAVAKACKASGRRSERLSRLAEDLAMALLKFGAAATRAGTPLLPLHDCKAHSPGGLGLVCRHLSAHAQAPPAAYVGHLGRVQPRVQGESGCHVCMHDCCMQGPWRRGSCGFMVTRSRCASRLPHHLHAHR